jgi:hypothetical protein
MIKAKDVVSGISWVPGTVRPIFGVPKVPGAARVGP